MVDLRLRIVDGRLRVLDPRLLVLDPHLGCMCQLGGDKADHQDVFTDSPEHAGTVDPFSESTSRRKFLFRLHEHGGN